MTENYCNTSFWNSVNYLCKSRIVENDGVPSDFPTFVSRLVQYVTLPIHDSWHAWIRHRNSDVIEWFVACRENFQTEIKSMFWSRIRYPSISARRDAGQIIHFYHDAEVIWKNSLGRNHIRNRMMFKVQKVQGFSESRFMDISVSMIIQRNFAYFKVKKPHSQTTWERFG